MIVPPHVYETAAEMRRAYAAVRNRCFGPPPLRVRYKPEPEPPPAPPPKRPTPKPVVVDEMTRKLRPRQIITAVAEAHGLEPAKLVSKRFRGGAREFQARQEIAKRLRFECGMSYPQIGRVMRRDHTTVMRMVDDAFRARHMERMSRQSPASKGRRNRANGK